jgi:hypothetical protein
MRTAVNAHCAFALIKAAKRSLIYLALHSSEQWPLQNPRDRPQPNVMIYFATLALQEGSSGVREGAQSAAVLTKTVSFELKMLVPITWLHLPSQVPPKHEDSLIILFKVLLYTV